MLNVFSNIKILTIENNVNDFSGLADNIAHSIEEISYSLEKFNNLTFNLSNFINAKTININFLFSMTRTEERIDLSSL